MSDTDLMFKATLDGSGFASGAQSINSHLSMLGSSAGMVTGAINAMAVAAVAAGAALVGLGAVGISAFKSLEASASDAASKAVDVNGKSTEEIKAQYTGIKDHVMKVSRELGASTVFDPTQVSDAFGAIAAAGKDVGSMTSEQLRPMLDLAASDMSYGLAPSTQLVMSTMAQFGKTMQDTGEIADIFAKGAAGSGAGLGDYATALEYVGPVAKSTGVSLETTVAMISKLRDNGIDASTAGTSLRDGLLQLSKDTPTLSKSLEKLGLSYADVDPRAHTFMETLELLKSKGANAYDLGEIFGQTSVSGVQTLMNLTDETKAFATELENSQGIARTMADLKLDSLEMDLEAAKGAASDLAIGIGERLSPSVRTALQAFSAFAPTIQEFIDAAFDLDFGKIASMLSDVGGQIVDYFKNIDYKAIGNTLHEMLRSAWHAAAGLFSTFLSSDTELTGAFSALKDVLAPTVEDIFGTLQIAGLKAFMAIADGAGTMYNELGATLYGLYNNIVAVFAGIAGVIGGAWDYASGKIGELKEYLGVSSSESSESMPEITNDADTGYFTIENAYLTQNMSKRALYTTEESLTNAWNSGQITIQSAEISIASSNDLKTGLGLSEMYSSDKLHAQGISNTVRVQSDEEPGILDKLSDTKDYLVGGGLTQDLMEFSLAKSGAVGQRTAVEEAEKIASVPVEERTDVQNAIVAESDDIKESKEYWKDIKESGKNGITADEEANQWEKDFLEKYQKKWEDMTLFSQSETGNQWLATITKLEAAKQEIESIGGDQTNALEKIDDEIKSAKTELGNAIADAATTVSDTSSLYYAEFQGLTKEYAAAKAQSDKDTATSALVNAQDPRIATVGSMTGYTDYARQGLKASGIDIKDPVMTLIDEKIAQLKTAKDELSVTTTAKIEVPSDAEVTTVNAVCETINTTFDTPKTLQIDTTDAEMRLDSLISKSGNLYDSLTSERTATRSISFKTATPEVGTQAGTQNTSAILQNIYTSIDRNTNRQILASATQFSLTRASITLSMTSITTGIAGATSTITTAITNAAAAIVDAILSSGGGCGGMNNGGGSGGSESSGGSFWSGTSHLGGSSGALFSYSFSEGGYVDRPTFAIVGDSPGGEYMVPANKLNSFLNSMTSNAGASLDSSGMQAQLQNAISSLSIPPIPIRLTFDVDSESVRAMLTDALYDILAGVRL